MEETRLRIFKRKILRRIYNEIILLLILKSINSEKDKKWTKQIILTVPFITKEITNIKKEWVKIH